MADLSKLMKKRGTLGAPPSEDEASGNLTAPEAMPAPAPAPVKVKAPSTPPAPVEPVVHHRRDARSARKTNRTIPFATRVSPEFDTRFRDAADRDGLKLAELLEHSLDAYERHRRK